MTNLTSGSVEYFPLLKKLNRANHKKQQAISSLIDLVEDSAENVISNGGGNYVGEACHEINILNSSGCVVTSGVIGVNLFACSGLTVTESNVIYIKNIKITEDSFTSGTISSSFRTITADSTYLLPSDETVQLSGEAVTVTYLPSPVGHHRIIDAKNLQAIDTVISVGGSDTIDIDFVDVTLSYLDNVTLQSDGISNWIIK